MVNFSFKETKKRAQVKLKKNLGKITKNVKKNKIVKKTLKNVKSIKASVSSGTSAKKIKEKGKKILSAASKKVKSSKLYKTSAKVCKHATSALKKSYNNVNKKIKKVVNVKKLKNDFKTGAKVVSRMYKKSKLVKNYKTAAKKTKINKTIKLIKKASKEVGSALVGGGLLSSSKKVSKIMSGIKKNIVIKTSIKKDGFKPQGLAKLSMDNGTYAFISAYDNTSEDKRKSRVYVYDTKTGEKVGIIELDHKSHVGGLTFDAENGIMFVSGKNLSDDDIEEYREKGKKLPQEIYAYKYENLLSALENPDGKKIYKINKTEDLIVGSEKFTTGDLGNSLINNSFNSSGLAYYDGALYSGTHNAMGTIIKIKYDYDKDNGTINPKKPEEFCKTGVGNQGLAIDEKNGLMYFTGSSGHATKSLIGTVDMKTRTVKNIQKIEPSGLEGIYVNGDGSLMGVFESSDKTGNIENLSKYTSKMDPLTSLSIHAGNVQFELNKKMSEIDKKLTESADDNNNISSGFY